MNVHPILVIQVLALLSIANGTPVMVKKIMGDRMSWPLDGGAQFLDGKPLFGRSKTIRGLVSSMVLTSLAAPLLGFHFGVGALVSISSMVGDLISSFLKRRLGLAPSSMALGLDQIPESLMPAIACMFVIPLNVGDIAAITIIFFIGELILSRLFYALRLRDQPY